MSVLLLTNPYAPQQGQPQAQQSEGRSVAAPGLMPSFSNALMRVASVKREGRRAKHGRERKYWWRQRDQL